MHGPDFKTRVKKSLCMMEINAPKRKLPFVARLKMGLRADLVERGSRVCKAICGGIKEEMP